MMILSLINSGIYWYLDNYTSHNHIKIPFKFASIILLMNWNYGLILTMYSFGDVLINYSEEKSIIFFGMGHLLFLYKTITLNSAVVIILSSPLLHYTTNFFMNILNKKDDMYYYYIFVLHLFLIVPSFSGYYGQFLFVLSDLLIGLDFNSTKKVEWILYYVSILCMKYWFDNSEINIIDSI